MPTYEYACTECHHEWEEIQRISEPPVEVCPVCKKVSAQRLISAGNFILKGGGWYADLYSSPKPKASDSSGSSASKPAEKPAEKDSGGSKTETKSADAKVETKATSSSTSTTPAT